MARKKSVNNFGLFLVIIALVAIGSFIYITYRATQQTQTQDSEASGRRNRQAVSEDVDYDALLNEADSVSEANTPLYFTDLDDLESE